NDYYSSEYLKDYKPYFDVASEFSGGNENARYYMNVGWNSVGTLLDVGDWDKARFNTFNVRGNVDLKVSKWIDRQLDAAAYFSNDRRQRCNYWSVAASKRTEEYTPYVPIE